MYSLIQAPTTLPAPPRINHFLSGPNLINFTSLIDPTLSTLFFFFFPQTWCYISLFPQYSPHTLLPPDWFAAGHVCLPACLLEVSAKR